MNKLIMIEGSQGVGKTTLCNSLQPRIKSSNLFKCLGIEDKTGNGFAKTVDYYDGWSLFLNHIRHLEIPIIFDRFVLSEVIYSRLYKEYTFDSMFKAYLNRFGMDAELYFIFMFLPAKDFKDRLSSRKYKQKYLNMEYHTKASVNQQLEYRKECDRLKQLDKGNVHILEIQGNIPTRDNVEIILEFLNN